MDFCAEIKNDLICEKYIYSDLIHARAFLSSSSMTSNQSHLPYGKQSISEDDISAVINVLRSPFLTQGPVVPAFEKAVAKKVGANQAVAVTNATSALHIACLALGLGPNDILWTSPTTFVASANCGRYCGAKVDFVDIDPATGLMSVEALRKKLQQAERDGTLPKIVVPVHLCGTSCSMKEIALLAQRYGFSVVEDASHAIGGLYKNKYVGSCCYSDITIFSFHPVKIITTGEGGLATTNNPELASKMYMLRSHGITKDEKYFQLSKPGPWGYEQQVLGFNYRMTDIQAALGLSQLLRLEEFVDERNSLYYRYKELLSDLPVKLLEIPSDVRSSLHLGVIRLNNISPELHRSVFNNLRASGIGVQLHYAPVHLQPYYQEYGFKKGNFPEAEAYATNAISLPLFPGLTLNNQMRVVKVLQEIL